jgi:Na+-transporting NADH:ubiquinone oxidoreductase subunit NqrC
MWVLFLLLMCSPVLADVYVLTDSNKSVVGLSEQDDMVSPPGHTIKIIPNKQIKDLTVSIGEEKLYDFNGSKFTLNSKKVQDKNKSESDALLAEQKKSSDKQSAISKLKILGLTDSEVEAILK